MTLAAAVAVASVANVSLAPTARSQTFTTYDAVDGFSHKTRKNRKSARWSYQYNTTGIRDGNYALLPDVLLSQDWQDNGTPAKVFYWHDAAQFNGYPYIGANTTNDVLSRGGCCGDIFLPAHSLIIDSGTLLPVLAFRSPVDGPVTIEYTFTHIDCHGGNGINYYVDVQHRRKYRNLATGLLKSASCDSPATTGDQIIPDVQVKSGDRIYFIIDNNGDYTFDQSALRARVSVPTAP
jgi:hypothetical protein